MYDGQTYVVMFVTQYKERQAIPYCALRGKGCTLFFVAHAEQKIHCLAPKFGAIVLPKILWADFILRPSDECVRLSALRIAAKKKRAFALSFNTQHHQPHTIRQCRFLRKHNINNHLPTHINVLLR